MIRTRTLKVLSLFKMKKAFLLLIFLISAAVGAQKTADRTIYLDSAFHETSKDKHVYYRVVSNYYKKQRTYLMVDYYNSGAPFTRNAIPPPTRILKPRAQKRVTMKMARQSRS